MSGIGYASVFTFIVESNCCLKKEALPWLRSLVDMKTSWAWSGKIPGGRWMLKEGLIDGWIGHDGESHVQPLSIASPSAHRWVFFGPQADLEEERIRQKIAERTSEETIRIYSLRLFLNCIVLAVLAACFYAIYRATIFSQEHMKKVSTLWKSV